MPKRKRKPKGFAQELSDYKNQRFSIYGNRESFGVEGICVYSKVGAASGLPEVVLEWNIDNNICPLSASGAIEHALGIIQAAIAAETDAVLVEFGHRIIGLEKDMTRLILHEFREFRNQNPKRFHAWRGEAMKILTSAEQAETDEFLRNFFERIKDMPSEDQQPDDSFDIELMIEDFQELREQLRSRPRL